MATSLHQARGPCGREQGIEMSMLDDWEYDVLKARVDAIMSEADANLHGDLAYEPNHPERETQVNHWNTELRKAHALRAKLDGLKNAESRPV